MDFRTGRKTDNLSAWDRFKQRKQEQQPDSFDDDDSLSSSKARGSKASPSSDFDDTFRPGSEWDDPTFDDNSIWGGKPTFTTNSFGDPLQKNWEDIGAKMPNGPLIPMGASPYLPGVLGKGRDPATSAIEAMIDQNGKSKFQFSGHPKYNEAFFYRPEGVNAIRIKDGVLPSEAMKNVINSKPGEYGFECATAISVFSHIKTYKEYQAQYGAAADAKFDKDFAGLQMGTWGNSTPGVEQALDPSRQGQPLGVGENYYFKNNQVDTRGGYGGWQGENVVFAGKAQADGPVVNGLPRFQKGEDLYFGHPFGVASRREIVGHLLTNASKVNQDGENALTEAISGASGASRKELSSLLQDLQATKRLRQDHRNELEGFFQELEARPGEFEAINQRFNTALAKDSALDRAEGSVTDRARDMLFEVNRELAATTNLEIGTAKGSARVQELGRIRDLLIKVLPGDRQIGEFRQ